MTSAHHGLKALPRPVQHRALTKHRALCVVDYLQRFLEIDHQQIRLFISGEGEKGHETTGPQQVVQRVKETIFQD